MIVASYTTMRALFATGSSKDKAGYEEWPAELVRANGFDGGFTGLTEEPSSLQLTPSVDGSANGAEAYHAYLRQRTDEPTKQYLQLRRSAGKSGTWVVSLSRVGQGEFGVSSGVDPITLDQMRIALRHCTLYVQRISDGAIQYVDLFDAVLPNG